MWKKWRSRLLRLKVDDDDEVAEASKTSAKETTNEATKENLKETVALPSIPSVITR